MNRVKNKLLLSGRKSVLKRAIWAVKANVQIAGGRGLFDLSGHGNHAYFGGNSTTPTTNDPTVLPWRGQKEVWFPGTAGNYISTPHASKYNPTASLGVKVEFLRAALAANYDLVSKFTGSGDPPAYDRAWRFSINTNNRLALSSYNAGGTAVQNLTSSVLPDDHTVFAFHYDISAGLVTFYSGASWEALSQLGTPQSVFTSLNTPGTDILIGNAFAGAGNAARGLFRNVEITVDGDVKASLYAANLSEPYVTHTDPQGNVWTLNRSSSGLKLAVVDEKAQTAGAGAALALGTDDFLEVANHPLLNFGAGQAFTAVSVWRSYTTGAGVMLAKRPNAGAGWQVGITAGDGVLRALVARGSSIADLWTVDSPSGSWTFGKAFMGGVRRNGSNQPSVTANDTITDSPSAMADSTTNSLPVRIGARGGGVYLDGEFFAAAIFRSALTQDELAQLAVELGVSS